MDWRSVLVRSWISGETRLGFGISTLSVAFCWDADHSHAHRLSTIVFYFFLSQSLGIGAHTFPAHLAGSARAKAHRDVALSRLALHNESETSSCGNVACFFLKIYHFLQLRQPNSNWGALEHPIPPFIQVENNR